MKDIGKKHLEKDGLLNELDHVLEHLEEAMDEDFMQTGKTIAELFRAVCTAALKLPGMELYTELMEVHNSDEELAVIFHRNVAKAGKREGGNDTDDGSDGCDYCDCCGNFEDDDRYSGYEDYDEEEEEMLYDGD